MPNQNESDHMNVVSNSFTDAELVRMAQDDIDHFGKIYTKYWESVYRFVYKRVSSESLVQDIAQDVFFKAMMNIGKYEDRGYALSSWLFRIAISETSNSSRLTNSERAFRANSKDLEDLMRDVYDESIDGREEALKRALEELREPELQLIQMRYFEKKKLKTVAEILDISESNCKVKMFRIMKKLRNKMGA